MAISTVLLLALGAGLLGKSVSNLVQGKGTFESDGISFDDSLPSDLLDGEYGALQQNNPWLQNTYGDPTFMDKLVHWFGGRSPYEEYVSQARQNAVQQDFDLRTAKREEDYNSAPASSEREIAAGLNPELLGVSSQMAGSATEMTETPLISPALDSQELFVKNIPTMMSNIFSGGMSALKGLREFQDLSINQYSSIDSLAGLNIENILGGLSPEQVQSYDLMADLETSNPFRKGSRLHRIYSDRYSLLANNRIKNFGNYNTSYKGYLDSVLQALTSKGKLGNARESNGIYSWNHLLQIFTDFQKDCFNEVIHSQHAKASAAANESAYQSHLDPVLAAESTNAQNQANKSAAVSSAQVFDLMTLIRTPVEKLIHNLSQMSESDKWIEKTFANGALSTLFGILLTANSGIGFSSGSHTAEGGSNFSFHF